MLFIHLNGNALCLLLPEDRDSDEMAVFVSTIAQYGLDLETYSNIYQTVNTERYSIYTVYFIVQYIACKSSSPIVSTPPTVYKPVASTSSLTIPNITNTAHKQVQIWSSVMFTSVVYILTLVSRDVSSREWWDVGICHSHHPKRCW